MIANHPLPTTDDPVDAPFWAGAREGVVRVQVCAQCDLARHPPRPMCPACQSMKSVWCDASGRGRLWSWTVPSPPLLPAFEAVTPYATAAVELEDFPGLRLIGPVLNPATRGMKGVDASMLRIGAAVNVAFFDIAEDVAFPGWLLAE